MPKHMLIFVSKMGHWCVSRSLWGLWRWGDGGRHLLHLPAISGNLVGCRHEMCRNGRIHCGGRLSTCKKEGLKEHLGQHHLTITLLTHNTFNNLRCTHVLHYWRCWVFLKCCSKCVDKRVDVFLTWSRPYVPSSDLETVIFKFVF